MANITADKHDNGLIVINISGYATIDDIKEALERY